MTMTFSSRLNPRFAPWLALSCAMAVPTGAAEVWVAPTHGIAFPAALDDAWPVTPQGIAPFGFSIPDDFDSLQAASVVILPTASGSGLYSVFAEVKRGGELISGFDIAAISDVPFSLVDDEVTEIDVSAIFAGLLDGTTAGNDYVSLFFFTPDLLASTQVLGLRFVYDARLIETDDIANGAVTSAKILNGTVTGTDIANGSVGAADLAANSVFSGTIGNGSILSQDLSNNSVISSKIPDGAVGKSEIAADSVGASELLEGELKTALSGAGVAVVPKGAFGPHIDRVVSTPRALNTNQSTIFDMSCPAGWFATGGGFDHDRQTSTGARIGPGSNVNSLLSFPSSQSTWRVGVISRDPSFLIITWGYVVCIELQ